MLYSTVTPTQRRRDLRTSLATGEIQRFPGAFTPLSARLIGERGFEGTYISGAVMANELGLPDVGLTSITEIAARAQQITRVTDLPTIVDADTGFGEPMNVARTVQQLEDAGVTGLHLEDQENPKRCGHLDGKRVVDTSIAVRRIRAAVSARRDENLLLIARTDARAPLGLSAAIDRAKAFTDAGADAIFPEAMASLSEFEAMRAAVDVPILGNITEFGKSELFNVEQLKSVGVNIVIFPVSLQRIAMGAIENGLDALERDGSFSQVVPRMQSRARLYEVVDYAGYAAFDADVFDFEVSRVQKGA